jgi:dTDP-4-dehydrorhamnose 3,5-epimerase
MRAWCVREFAENGLDFVPVQANMGFSVRKGTIRGMHYQESPRWNPRWFVVPEMFDFVLDVRPHSRSYRKWYGTELTAENARMLYVPEGCAHGYQTLEDETEMYYMATQFYTPSAAQGVRYDDPGVNISWPLAVTAVSEQERNWPLTGVAL